MLDATRLRVLAAIARHGSVTAAAQALNYAQPSISHHMARLESETGAKLMERAGRGIRLTDAGRLLAERAEEILGRLDAAEAELAAHIGLRRETVRLASFGSALGTLAATAAAALRGDRAVADVSLVQAEPAEALRMLRVGEVDVALVFRYVHEDDRAAGSAPDDAADSRSEEDLHYRPVLDEPVYLITPAAGEDPAAKDGGRTGTTRRSAPGARQPSSGHFGRRASGHNDAAWPPSNEAAPSNAAAASSAAAASILAGYADHRWVAGCDRCQDALRTLCRAAGFSPDIAVSTDDYVAAQALVAAGLGVAILPELALRALRHPGVSATRLPGTRRQVLTTTYGAPPESQAATALLAALSSAAAQFQSAL